MENPKNVAKSLDRNFRQIFQYYLFDTSNVRINIKTQKVLFNSSYVAGGAIVSKLLSLPINDFDLYFKTKSEAEQIKSVIQMKKNYTSLSPAAILDKTGLQIINLYSGEPEKVLESFDFVHCMTWWSVKEGKVQFLPGAFDAIKNKKLIYNKSKYPIIAFKRVNKYLSKGFTIEAEEIKKISDDLELKFNENIKELGQGEDILKTKNIIKSLLDNYNNESKKSALNIEANIMASKIKGLY